MQIIGPQIRPSELKTGVGEVICVIVSPLGESDVRGTMRTVLEWERRGGNDIINIQCPTCYDDSDFLGTEGKTHSPRLGSKGTFLQK